MKFNKLIPELDVINLKETLELYKLIGFVEIYNREEDKFSFIEMNECQFMLQELKTQNKWETGNLEYPFGRGINFQLEVINIEKIYKDIKESKYNIFEDMQENWYRQDNKLLGNKEFLIQDPNGYLLRLSEDIGEKEMNN